MNWSLRDQVAYCHIVLSCYMLHFVFLSHLWSDRGFQGLCSNVLLAIFLAQFYLQVAALPLHACRKLLLFSVRAQTQIVRRPTTDNVFQISSQPRRGCYIQQLCELRRFLASSLTTIYRFDVWHACSGIQNSMQAAAR